MPTFYTPALLAQLAEIPWQIIRQWRIPRGLSRPALHRFGPHPRQYLLWWDAAPDALARRSIVVFYHGGGWRVGQPGLFSGVAAFFQQEGFSVVMPAYRLTPRYAYPQMREDVNKALLKTLDVMATKGLSGKKILVSGMSAGATLAAHLAFNHGEYKKLGLLADLFSGFLSFAGPLDLAQLPDLLPVRRYAAGPPGSAAFVAANPLTWLEPDENLPALLLHGPTDAIVPFACSVSFAKCYPTPSALQFVPLPGRTHLDSLRFAVDDVEVARVLREWLADK